MLGVDQNEAPSVIEMKNNEVGEEILPQVLGYAMWAETNPIQLELSGWSRKTFPKMCTLIGTRQDAGRSSCQLRPTVARMAAKIGYLVD